MTILLLTGVLVMVIGMSVRLFVRRKWRHAVLALASGLLLTTALVSETLPVRNMISPHTGTDVLYVGVTEPAYLERIESLRDGREMIIVGLVAAEKVIKKACPWAKFEAPITELDLRQGVTLGVAISDLKQRLPLLRDGGKVYFLIPRTDNLSRDRSALEELVSAEPWLRDRLRTLFPGSGDARAWPLLPAASGDAPVVIDPDSPDYQVDVSVDGRSSMESMLSLNFAHAGERKPVSVQPDNKSFVTGGSGDSIRLLTDMPLLRGTLPNPGRGRTNNLIVKVGTRYGETISQVQLTTRCEPPEIPVLIPMGRNEDSSDLVKLLRANRLTVRPIPVLLPDTKEKLGEPKFQQNVQFAEAVKGLGLLFVDLGLNEFEGQGLNNYLTNCESPPTLMFVGTDGQDTSPPGWSVFVGATNKVVTSRRVVLVKDMSGSMEEPADPSNPSKFRVTNPTTNQTHNASRIDIANAVALRLYKGLGQRNVNGVLLPIGPADPRDANGTLLPYDHNSRKEFEEKTTADPILQTLAQYTAEGNTDRHKWEFGPHLVAIKSMMEKQPKEPISDVIAVIDATDVPGYPPTVPDKIFKDEQVAAANWLRAHGVRIHTIGIGGDMDPQVESAIGGKPFLNFPTMPNTEELLNAVERHVYENVLPRLPLLPGEDGLKTLDKEKADALRAALANPNLKLINVLFEYQNRQTANSKDVLVWGSNLAPGSEGLGSPVFFRRSYDASIAAKGRRDCYWVALDIRAELAASEKAGIRQRNALSDLLISCINSVTASALTPTPVVWQMDSSGYLRIMKRDRKPFNLVEFQAKAGRSAVEIDTRQLSRPGFRFPDLPSDKPEEVQVTVTDRDPRVGKQEVRLHLIGTPALPLSDKPDRDLFGEAATVTKNQVGKEVDQPFALSSTWMLVFAFVGWMAWCVMVWRN